MSIEAEWKHGHDRFPRLFWRLDDDAYRAFREFGQEKDFAAGERLFESGDPSHALFLVQEGEIAIQSNGVEVARIGAHHSLGEMGLLRDAPRAGAAVALTETRVLELSREDLHRMLLESPVWAARLYRVLAECLAEYFHRSLQAARKPADDEGDPA